MISSLSWREWERPVTMSRLAQGHDLTAAYRLWHKICPFALANVCLRRWNMARRARNLGVVLCLLCAAMVAGCPGDRMSQNTTEAVDDSLIANKVTLALYSDKQVNGRGIKVESAQGVVELTGVVASAAEAHRAEQIAQQVKGVKTVHNRLKIQEKRPEPAPRTSSSPAGARQ
jgi:hyperosmotically inducible periplasmic protein